MEFREDLRSILPFLPLKLDESTLIWPNRVIEALKSLSIGPSHSRVDSGEVLFLAISDIRRSLSLSGQHLSPYAADGYVLFFDEFLSRKEAAKWFEDVMPAMANLLLRLPVLLESHFLNADTLLNGVPTGLRLLDAQQPGIVFLSQELIGALLSCSFLCLFPTVNRVAKHLPWINFDRLFSSLYAGYHDKQEHKIKCLIHYFERACLVLPTGAVSFERKCLPLDQNSSAVAYPNADYWSTSVVPLCQFKVCRSGLIEDHSRPRALEVDFANEYLGGGALSMGCVQEEIRFMINPELIAGMIFLPRMSDNESIEIVGAERFSEYTGYASSFRFVGDFVDRREMDSMRRRSTRIVAIDALFSPGSRQYRLDSLLREVDKAFCGFLDQSRFQQWHTSQVGMSCALQHDNDAQMHDNFAASVHIDDVVSREQNDLQRSCHLLDPCNDTGIVTGNWGCGAFGGDPEVKTILQWLAASQAQRPFILYYTFDLVALDNLQEVCDWILSHNWDVGDLWNMLVEYSSRRANNGTKIGFFTWLLPSLSQHDVPMSDHCSRIQKWTED